ncbi:hypothetical protein [Mycolicibacterium sp.]|uniref:AMP-binding enzyme n=1 Tax=Mycolicibacterium sp. TaxID=2320850 RepID=UPI0037CC6033
METGKSWQLPGVTGILTSKQAGQARWSWHARCKAGQLLRACLRENLTGYKQPRHIQFVEELPKTNVGKVLRRALHDL